MSRACAEMRRKKKKNGGKQQPAKISRDEFRQEKYNVCIICEGYEEFDYISQLNSLHVWNNIYRVKPHNAESMQKIPKAFQGFMKSSDMHVVVIFCDTEMPPYTEFMALRDKINETCNNDKAADNLIFYCNPCTLQIVLSHYGNVRLKTNNKSENGKIIFDLTRKEGLKDYDGKAEQRFALCADIKEENFDFMMNVIKNLQKTFIVTPSTNAYYLFDNLRNGSTIWIDFLRAFYKGVGKNS